MELEFKGDLGMWNLSNSVTVTATCTRPLPSRTSAAQQTRFWKKQYNTNVKKIGVYFIKNNKLL